MKKILLVAILAIGLQAQVDLNKCYGCHGKTFEKKALGKSKVVQDMNTSAIVERLEFYKKGKVQGTGIIMFNQVKDMNSSEINSTAVSIKGLKK